MCFFPHTFALQAARHDKWSARSPVLATWFRGLWKEVQGLKATTPLVVSVLQAHGFREDGNSTMPRTEELKRSLTELETAGAPAEGSSKLMFEQAEAWAYDEEVNEWAQQLPSNLKRAGPEIYRNILTSGYNSLRDYINSLFPLEKRDNTSAYYELFSIATSIDFMLKGKRTALEVTKLLSESDQAEIGLTRIASFIHLRTTGDAAAATSMLALQPPGSLVDVAPKWKIDEAATYSQAEFRRRERRRGSGGTSGGQGAGEKGKSGGKKGGSKGGAGKKSGGKGDTSAPQQA